MSSISYTTKSPVFVTGATGYVAGWLIKKLLDEGVTVHAAVRDPTNKAKLSHLEKVAEVASGQLKFFKADLLDNGSFDAGMKGCKVVFHTASPFTSKITDPQKDLVDPAKLGTANVLDTVNRTPSVERVVLTSSCAAIYGDNKDLQSVPNETLTEEIWNKSSSLNDNAYAYSKTVAEKEAWEINSKQKSWKLVVVNPSLVLGPGLNPDGTSESFSVIKSFGDGLMKQGCPNIELGVVDVRDLADAHFRAAFVEGANGRNIISGHNTSFLGIGKELSKKYSSYPLPQSTVPKFIIWLFGPMLDANLTRKFVSNNVNYPWKADNSKSITELGVTYRPLDETVNDFFQQLIDTKRI